MLKAYNKNCLGSIFGSSTTVTFNCVCNRAVETLADEEEIFFIEI